MPEQYTIRIATAPDIPVLHELIEQSIRGLQKDDYSQAQIAGAIGNVLGLDTQLIADGTYFVAEAAGVVHPIACGGWSFRRTLFGSDGAASRESRVLDPATEPAKIRAIFVHPNFDRRGLGSRILECAETAAASAGFTRFEMGSTLTGIALYRLRGYQTIDEIRVPLPNGESLPVVRMSRSIR